MADAVRAWSPVNHLDQNPRFLGQADRLDRFGPWRIDHGKQTEEGQAVLNILVLQQSLIGRCQLASHSQDPQSLGTPGRCLHQDRLPLQRLFMPITVPHAAAVFQDPLQGPFDVDEAMPVRTCIMQRGHVLPLGFKGEHVQAGQFFLEHVGVQSGFACYDEERPFRGIALDVEASGFFHQHSIIAEHAVP